MSVLALLANLLGPSAFTAQDEYQRQPLYYGMSYMSPQLPRLVDRSVGADWLWWCVMQRRRRVMQW